MTVGMVKNWVSDRGCGLIISDELKDEILVKSSSLKNTIYLEKGDKVRFDVKKTKVGKMAIKVKLIN